MASEPETWQFGPWAKWGMAGLCPLLQAYYTGNIPPREPQDKTISQYELQKAIRLIESGFNPVALTWRNSLKINTEVNREIKVEAIVISDPADPYYSLAQEIARSENIEIAPNFTQALKSHPKFMIMVAAPQNLTEERLLNIGRIFKSMDHYPALGIITGSTLPQAEQLWLRGAGAQDGQSYLGTDVDQGHLIDSPTIYDLSADPATEMALTKENLINTLQQADYYYWPRHVSDDKWFWNTESQDFGENDKLYAADLPELKPAVIHAPACGSFQPWLSDSIALGFVDHGAAAYLGHVHSPISGGIFMRRGLDTPGITSWEEFPVGIMAQIQNRMSTKAAFDTPQYFMLGDPRIYLTEGQPYQINSDTID